jgi:hypothetical protein
VTQVTLNQYRPPYSDATSSGDWADANKYGPLQAMADPNTTDMSWARIEEEIRITPGARQLTVTPGFGKLLGRQIYDTLFFIAESGWDRPELSGGRVAMARASLGIGLYNPEVGEWHEPAWVHHVVSSAPPGGPRYESMTYAEATFELPSEATTRDGWIVEVGVGASIVRPEGAWAGASVIGTLWRLQVSEYPPFFARIRENWQSLLTAYLDKAPMAPSPKR